MRTPAGKECKYFYNDYYRGREVEECRLLKSASPPLKWKRDLCNNCPVPAITLSNACSHMVLRPSLGRDFPFIRQSVRIKAFCTKTSKNVEEPHIGCGECHPLPFKLPGDRIETDTAD